MQWVDRIRQVKIILVLSAVVIAVTSLIISHYLVRDLSREEQYKMEVWAEAMRTLNTADVNTDLNLVLKVLNSNQTIPIIVIDSKGRVTTTRNIELSESLRTDSASYLIREAQRMKNAGYYIRLNLDTPDSTSASDYIYICYDESSLLKRLGTYPYVQLGVVFIFVIVAIFALLSSKRAEQNKVWVGLSKETAHQLGTPISSLMAWVEILKETYPEDALLPELDKDVKRLELIAERFSKIGSVPEPKTEDLSFIIKHVTDYIVHRTSSKVQVICKYPEEPIFVCVNVALFEWVIENLCKNAIDAMSGQGAISINVKNEFERVVIEIADTGKGITKKHFKSVFTPGYTTKARGWGLGLSLAKRIVEEYHKGKIYVKSSELGKGTVFRIELQKA